MNFTTPVPIERSEFQISYDSKVVSIGSCFAQNMARKFDYYQFQNLANPFGILFHPLAIEKMFKAALAQKHFTDADVFFHNERWQSFDVHSELSHADKRILLERLNDQVVASGKIIQDCTHLIITLGTAWIYRHQASGDIVANCHKVPQREFTKELLAPEEVSASVETIIRLIQQANPSVQILFTISPVRHLKDGFIENQRSKSNLISGLHKALSDKKNCHYFPAFEIVMDELRDYRFYASDMMHPNELAIDYIWEKFVYAWMSDDAVADMAEVEALRKALSHQAFHPDSEKHLKFLAATQQRIAHLRERLPFLSF